MKSVNRIELGRLLGWVEAKDKTNAHGKGKGSDNGRYGNNRLHFSGSGNPIGRQNPNDDSNNTTHKGDDHSLYEELGNDNPVGGP